MHAAVWLQHLSMFRSIVKDVFSGLPDASTQTARMSAQSRTADIESALELMARERGYVAHKLWIDKCIQLFNVSQVHHGM